MRRITFVASKEDLIEEERSYLLSFAVRFNNDPLYISVYKGESSVEVVVSILTDGRTPTKGVVCVITEDEAFVFEDRLSLEAYGFHWMSGMRTLTIWLVFDMNEQVEIEVPLSE